MMDPQTAMYLAGRLDPHRGRDARQRLAARDAQANQPSGLRSAVERVQTLLGRTESPSSASCDCTDS
jgi:hypothetical protein